MLQALSRFSGRAGTFRLWMDRQTDRGHGRGVSVSGMDFIKGFREVVFPYPILPFNCLEVVPMPATTATQLCSIHTGLPLAPARLELAKKGT